MAKHEFSAPWSIANTPLTQATIGGIVAALDAVAARAGVPGQVDPETVQHSNMYSVLLGFAVWHIDDELHATHPVYIRLDFLTGTGTTWGPVIALTVGRGVDGAGAITGVLFARREISSMHYVIADPLAGLASGGPGYVAFAPRLTVDPDLAFFVVERSRDAHGAPTEHGVLVTTNMTTLASSSTLPGVWTYNYATGNYLLQAPPVSFPSSINGVSAGRTTSLAAGGMGPVFPWVLMAPGVAPWQSCAVVSVFTGDHPQGVFETRLCGSPARFNALPEVNTTGARHRKGGVALAPGQVGSALAHAPAGMGALAVRWED